jgi:hypothetical protein
MLFDAHGDDLENGEEDRRRCHGRWELQHGRDIGRYLGRGDHPVKRIQLLPVLRLMALRAMKNTRGPECRDWKAKCSIF